MRKVYIVTRGDWDDYDVVAVFSTMELAEKYVEQNPSTEYDPVCIQEFEIDKID